MLTLSRPGGKVLAGVFLAVFFINPVFADYPVGTPENPECTKAGEPIIPEEFWDELARQRDEEESLGLRPFAEEEVIEEMIRQGKRPGEWFHIDRRNTPGFKERLEKWRLEQGLPATVECPPPEPESLAITPLGEATVSGITELPQHSLSNNIFRKQRILIDIYDSGIQDGDVVGVFFNGRFQGNYALPRESLSTSLILTLEPSDLLPAKTNVIRFQGAASGGLEKMVTLGVKVRPSQIFSGSFLAKAGGGNQLNGGWRIRFPEPGPGSGLCRRGNVSAIRETY